MDLSFFGNFLGTRRGTATSGTPFLSKKESWKVYGKIPKRFRSRSVIRRSRKTISMWTDVCGQ